MKKLTLQQKDAISGYLFIAPLTIGLLLFLAFPLVYSIFLSMTRFDSFNPPKFIGFDNFVRLFSDEISKEEFWNAVGNMWYYSIGVVLATALSVIIAVLLCSKIKGMTFFRSVFFLPAICSAVSITFIWRWMFDYNVGIFNIILEKLGLEKIKWLNSDINFMPSMILMGVWSGMGISIVLFIAAIKNVSPTYYEAAQIDGANAFRRFIHITLPAISPVTFYVLLTGSIGWMQEYARFELMTNGIIRKVGDTPVRIIYRYIGYTQYGYAASVALSFGIMLVLVMVAYFLISKRMVSYDS